MVSTSYPGCPDPARLCSAPISNLSVDAPAPVAAPAVVAAAPIPLVDPSVTLLDSKSARVIDSLGADQGRKLSAIDRMRLFRALGAVDAENRQVVNYATLAASVTELDGVRTDSQLGRWKLTRLSDASATKALKPW